MSYKRKKSSRHRGSFTHGWGAKKKHRGAGHRGGRGNAGSGKKGDCKKPRYWSTRGRRNTVGFKSKNPNRINAITITTLDQKISNLVEKGFATQKGGAYEIDLVKAGFDKLLGTGNTSKQFNIKVDSATESAMEKIKNSKGSVSVTKQEETS